MRKLTCLLTLGLALGIPGVAAAEEPEGDGAGAEASVSLSGATASGGSSDDAKKTENVYMGAEVSRVASSFEEDDIFDIHFGVGYDFTFKRAAILREWNSGGAGDTQNRLVKDLLYRQLKHTLTPTIEVGLWHDLALYLTMPVVLADSRDYSFDQRVDDCVFGDQANATCTNKDNSTAIRDAIIPRDGFDATSTANPAMQFTGSGTELIFRGPQRRGLDQLHVGAKYGILNQQKRSHMPNWIIAGEGRFAIGRAQTFRRDITVSDPAGNHRVGRRIHELGAWTALSRRYRFLDPYFVAYWRQSLRAGDSSFQDFSQFGQQDTILPQSTAGVTIGSEIVPFERKSRNVKLSVDVSGTAILHYGGRGYSEVWELLADSPSLVGSFDPTNSCDRDAAVNFAATNVGDPGYLAAGGGSCQPFEGVTEIQDYGSFGFNAGLNLHLSKYFRINLGTRLMTDTRHFVTFAKRGDAAGGSDPDRVEPGTREVNPMRRDVVDNVGRRFAVDDVINFDVFLKVLATF